MESRKRLIFKLNSQANAYLPSETPHPTPPHSQHTPTPFLLSSDWLEYCCVFPVDRARAVYEQQAFFLSAHNRQGTVRRYLLNFTKHIGLESITAPLTL